MLSSGLLLHKYQSTQHLYGGIFTCRKIASTTAVRKTWCFLHLQRIASRFCSKTGSVKSLSFRGFFCTWPLRCFYGKGGFITGARYVPRSVIICFIQFLSSNSCTPALCKSSLMIARYRCLREPSFVNFAPINTFVNVPRSKSSE